MAITMSMLLLVLRATSSERFRTYTGLLCGCWLALLVLFESPISGTSLNPARTFGPNLVAAEWNHMLLYFIAPPLGAQLAVLIASRTRSREAPCAKLHHDPPGHPRSRACLMKGCAYKSATEETAPAT
jgi:aquaporin Z